MRTSPLPGRSSERRGSTRSGQIHATLEENCAPGSVRTDPGAQFSSSVAWICPDLVLPRRSELLPGSGDVLMTPPAPHSAPQDLPAMALGRSAPCLYCKAAIPAET